MLISHGCAVVAEEHGVPLKVVTAPAVASSSHGLASPPIASPPAPANAWQCFIDPQTKYPYYFNSVTGESSWEAPAGWSSALARAPVPTLPHTAVDIASAAQVRAAAVYPFAPLADVVWFVFLSQAVTAAQAAPVLATGPSEAELEATRKMQAESLAREKAEQDAALALKKAEIEAAARRQLEEELAAMKTLVRMLWCGRSQS